MGIGPSSYAHASGTLYAVLQDSADAVAILDRDLKQIGRVPVDTGWRVPAHGLAIQGDSVIGLADVGRRRVMKYIRRCASWPGAVTP